MRHVGICQSEVAKREEEENKDCRDAYRKHVCTCNMIANVAMAIPHGGML